VPLSKIKSKRRKTENCPFKTKIHTKKNRTVINDYPAFFIPTIN